MTIGGPAEQSLEQMSAEELRALVRRSESALDAVDAGVYVIDTGGAVTYINEAGARLLGYSAREILGQSAHELIHHHYADGKAFPAEECPIYGTFTDGITQRVGGDVFWRRDGSKLPVDYVSIPVREGRRLTGAVVTFRDASEQIRLREQAAALAAEQAMRAGLERTAREVEQLADSLPQLAWMTDDTGYITWYNQRWYDYTGTTLDEMRGWGWQTVHHPDYVGPVTERFKEAVRKGEPWEDTFPLRSAQGEYRWFLSRALPMRNESGRITRWFGTNTDVTEQRAAAVQRDEALAEAKATQRMMLTVFEQAPAAISVTEGPEHRFVSANALYRSIVGERPLVGYTLAEAMPEVAAQGFVELLDGVYESGEPYVGRNVPVRWRVGDTVREGAFDFVYQPLKNAAGNVYGILTHAVEVRSAAFAAEAR
jgi:PAS domain S-box-containing protein